MTNQSTIQKHTVPETLVLHLLPGILTGIFYFVIRAPLYRIGYPSLFALMLGVLFVIVPFELGYLLYQGKQKTGRFTLAGMISYRESIPVWQYFVWVLVVFVVIGMIFTVMKPVDTFLQENLFSWVPKLESGLEGGFSKSNLIVTYIFVSVFGVVLGPLTEELYFRGYLLPRMPGEKLSVLWHSLLFAVYHVFTPWMILTRTIGLLPLIYAVKKKNIYVGIIVHILVNSIDAIMGFAFIASMA